MEFLFASAEMWCSGEWFRGRVKTNRDTISGENPHLAGEKKLSLQLWWCTIRMLKPQDWEKEMETVPQHVKTTSLILSNYFML